MSKDESLLSEIYAKAAPYITFKTIAWFLVSVLAGSGAMGIFSEFAAYSYAAYYGFRPPVEGIPYLRATTSLLTFISVLIYFVAFLLIYYLVRSLDKFYQFVSDTIRFKPLNVAWGWTVYGFGYNSREDVKKAVITAVFNAFATLAFMLAFIAIILGVSFVLALPWWLIFTALIFTFIYNLILLVPKYAMLTANTIALVLVVSLLASMFNAPYYGKYLKFVGFGGGKVVSVFYDSGKNKKPIVEVEGGLMIRGSEFLILYRKNEKDFTEIPLNRISKISYNDAEEFILPEN